MQKSVHQYPKEGDIFHHDRAEVRQRSLTALQAAKRIESKIRRITVRIDSRTVILVPEGSDIQTAIERFTKRLQPCM